MTAALVAWPWAAACNDGASARDTVPDSTAAAATTPEEIEPGGWVLDQSAGMEVRCPPTGWTCARDPASGAALLARDDGQVRAFLQRIVGAKSLREGVDRLAVVGARLVNTRHLRSRKHARGREVTFDERSRVEAAPAGQAGPQATPGRGPVRRFWALVTQRSDGAVVVCQGSAPRERFAAVEGELRALCETLREPGSPPPPAAQEGAPSRPATSGPSAAAATPAPAARQPATGGTVLVLGGAARVRCPPRRGWSCAGPRTRGDPPHRPASPQGGERPVVRGPHGESVRVYALPGVGQLIEGVDLVARDAVRQAGVTTIHQRSHPLGLQLDYERPSSRPHPGDPTATSRQGGGQPPEGATGGEEGTARETVWILLRRLPPGRVVACEGAAPTREFATAAPVFHSVCQSLAPSHGARLP